jgi:hypothetical protein
MVADWAHNEKEIIDAWTAHYATIRPRTPRLAPSTVEQGKKYLVPLSAHGLGAGGEKRRIASLDSEIQSLSSPS